MIRITRNHRAHRLGFLAHAAGVADLAGPRRVGDVLRLAEHAGIEQFFLRFAQAELQARQHDNRAILQARGGHFLGDGGELRVPTRVGNPQDLVVGGAHGAATI